MVGNCLSLLYIVVSVVLAKALALTRVSSNYLMPLTVAIMSQIMMIGSP